MSQKNKKAMTPSEVVKLMVVSSRPISWINTAYPFVAGYLATGGVVNTYFWVVAFYFLIPYNFLIYIVNDVFDYESDKRNPRKNSIEGGLLAPETHRTLLGLTVLFNGIVLTYIFAYGIIMANALLALIVLGAVSYSVPVLRFKERPFLDSINSSFHFVSPLLFAFTLTGWSNEFTLYIIAFFLWGCASHAFGAVQDINADRVAGIASIATYLGAKQTVRLSLGLYLCAAITLALCGWPAVVVCLPVLGYAALVARFVNLADKNAEAANKGWRLFLLLNQLTGFTVTVVLIAAKVF